MVKILVKDFMISFLYVCIKIIDYVLLMIFIFYILIIWYSFVNKDVWCFYMVLWDRCVMVIEVMK